VSCSINYAYALAAAVAGFQGCNLVLGRVSHLAARMSDFYYLYSILFSLSPLTQSVVLSVRFQNHYPVLPLATTPVAQKKLGSPWSLSVFFETGGRANSDQSALTIWLGYQVQGQPN
jgi:hypothetical protein